ncbi:MAG: putative portal protein [Prokaryotic dsDNA virus sp.]|jgi:hypothetical protein|nr:MAG: putative portal protein [Prokaryotic dsDNA virus sp.]|tara:strand:+ start:2190 stop:4214 length:2025 start_codon:yes stop_codon:yes gene_type:complete
MAKMDDIEFQSVVRNEIEQALGHYDTEYSQDRIDAMDYYLGEPFGNEQPDRSQVVSTEVSDTIEHIMPSLMRIFTQSDDYVRFVPHGPEDVAIAEQASDYCNWVINNDNRGFEIMHNWFKDALILKSGVVKFYWDEIIEVETEEYEGLNEDELTILLADPEVDVVSRDERTIGEDMEGPEGIVIPAPVIYDVKIKRTKNNGNVRIENVPPEEFLIGNRAKSLEDANFVAHRSTMTVSDLVSMGYDRDEIEQYAGYTDLDISEERTSRFEDLETSAAHDSNDPTMRNVLVTECYIRSDYDGDGVAEFRRVLTIGDGYHILENEEFDHIPFAILSPILMPHRAIGRSVAELIMDVQLIKSTLMRQLLDNIYNTNNARVVAVEGQVNLDDLLTNRPGGIVRTRTAGAVQPLQVPEVSSSVFPALNYMDSIKEQRTGISRQSMGLDADALQSTTATAVAAMQAASQGKIEMIARVFAETGVRALFRGILHLVTKYQNKEKIIRLRNQFVPMNPREWESAYDVQINVGLGTAQRDQQIAFLSQIAQKQEQIIAQFGPQNPMVSMSQYRNTLAKIAELSGFKDATQFFAPSEQIEAVLAQQAQAAAQAGPQQNPAVAAEMQKMQAELQMEQQKMEMEFQLKREKMAAELELRRQELEFEMQLRTEKLRSGVDTSLNLPRV